MSWTNLALIAGAGLLAGAANSVAGGGTLVSFPALLAAGLPPVTANITSSVGLVSGYLGGAVGYRRELAGQRTRMRALGLTAVAGGVAGAVILLVTPADAFRAAVPYLVLLSCLLLLVQSRVSRWVAMRREQHPPRSEITLLVQAGVFVAAVYGSYFGAGLGVLLLGVLGILLADDLQRLNGLKSLLSFVVKIVGVLVFLASGRVAWPYAGVLLVTAYVGGLLGAHVARRMRPGVLRVSVAVLGVAVAGALFATG